MTYDISPRRVALDALSLDPGVQGPIWSHGGEQLDVNLLYFDEGSGVPPHVNQSLDVWIVVIQGEGEAQIDGAVYPLSRGTCLYIAAGSERAIHSTGGPLIYASAHQKRGPLRPL
jgi:quercetin dioxygenase-like cupin family protein